MDASPHVEGVVSLDAARLERAVRAACAVAFADARRARPRERFYAFGVWAGPGHELAAVSSTEEAVRAASTAVRWRPREWPGFAQGGRHFAAARALLERMGDSPLTRARALQSCTRALRALDEDGHFGSGPERSRVVVTVFTPAATPEELVAVARGLNPPEAVARLARELRARPDVLGPDERAYAVDALAAGADHVAALLGDAAIAWSWPDGGERLRLPVPGAWALALAGDLLVVGEGRRGGLHLARLDDALPATRVEGPASGVAALALADDARALFVAGHDEELWRVDASRGAVRAARRARALSLAVSPAGDRVAVATGARALLVDAGSLGSRQALGRRTDRFRVVAFSPDARDLLAGGADADPGGKGVLAVFDVASGRERGRVEAGDEVTCVACSPDGRLVAAGDGSGAARVWELDGLAEVTRVQGTQQALSAVAFAPASADAHEPVLLTAGRDVDRGPAVRCWPLPSASAAPAGRTPDPRPTRARRARPSRKVES